MRTLKSKIKLFSLFFLMNFGLQVQSKGQGWSLGLPVTARQMYTSTLLPNGTVLIVGGLNNGQYLSSCEIYDPSSGGWRSTGSLAMGRSFHTATLLYNGKVLVTGGTYGTELSSCEIYDPFSGSWSSTSSMATQRFYHTSQLLPNNKVLVMGDGSSGGLSGSCELYDPLIGTWSNAGSLGYSSRGPTSTLLPNGKVLVAGGMIYPRGRSTATCQTYDPSSNTWNSTGSMVTARYAHSATLLNNGKVLVVGGYDPSGNDVNNKRSCEIYDPVSGLWSGTGSMLFERFAHSAVLLQNGNVLVMGGRGNIGEGLFTCEIYDPTSGIWSSTTSMATPHYHAPGTLLSNGKVLVQGGTGSDVCQVNSEFYEPFTTFYPNSGPIGTNVTIVGTNFSTIPDSNFVFFGATRAKVIQCTTTKLSVIVPPGATYQPISVMVNGISVFLSKPFNVTFNTSGVINANIFSPKVDFVTGANPGCVAIGDLDNNGKPDVVTVNRASNTISVLKNTNTGSINATTFSAKVDYATGVNPYCVAIGDLDGDGKSDLAVANFNGNSISVFRNMSTVGIIDATSFSAKVDFVTGVNPSNLNIGDFDGDGKFDLVVTNSFNGAGGNSISIFRNASTIGTIAFDTKVDFTAGINPLSVAIADLDGDGKSDLAVANSFNGAGGNSVSIFKNTSTIGTITSGSFATKVDFATGKSPYHVSICDIDGDAKLDLAVANFFNGVGGNFISILGNTGNISFAPKVDFTTNTNPRSIAFGDVDEDGKQDMIVTNYGSSRVSVFKNISVVGSITASSFAARVNFTTGMNPISVAIGDIDGDGKQELIVANYGTARVSVFRH